MEALKMLFLVSQKYFFEKMYFLSDHSEQQIFQLLFVKIVTIYLSFLFLKNITSNPPKKTDCNSIPSSCRMESQSDVRFIHTTLSVAD